MHFMTGNNYKAALCAALLVSCASLSASAQTDPVIRAIDWQNDLDYFTMTGWVCQPTLINASNIKAKLNDAGTWTNAASVSAQILTWNTTKYSEAGKNAVPCGANDVPGIVKVTLPWVELQGKQGLRLYFQEATNHYVRFHKPGETGHNAIDLPVPMSKYDGSVWVNNDAWVHEHFPTLKGGTTGRNAQDTIQDLRDMHTSDLGGGFTGVSQLVTTGDFALWPSDNTSVKQSKADLETYWNNRLGPANPCDATQFPELPKCDNLYSIRMSTNTAYDSITDAMDWTGAELKILSFRANDHHQLNWHYDSDCYSIPSGRLGRMMSAVTPKFATLADNGGTATDANGTTQNVIGDPNTPDATGACDIGSARYTLNYGSSASRIHKKRLFEDLADDAFQADVYEIDLNRSIPYFYTGSFSTPPTPDNPTIMQSMIGYWKAAIPSGSDLFFRIPKEADSISDLALTQASLDQSGIDGVIISTGKTTLSTDVKSIASLDYQDLPENIFWELFQNAGISRGSPNIFRPVTPHVAKTQAYAASQMGYNGLSWFNFHYYKSKFPVYTGTNLTKPHKMVDCVRDPICYSYTDQHYIATSSYRNFATKAGLSYGNGDINAESRTFEFNLVAPLDGWAPTGHILRLVANQSDKGASFKGTSLSIDFNGTQLTTSANEVPANSGGGNYFFSDEIVTCTTEPTCAAESYWYDANYARTFEIPASALQEGQVLVTISQAGFGAQLRPSILELKLETKAN